jgi:hypothetical protein
VVNIFQNAYRGARQILSIQSCCEKDLLQFSYSYQSVWKLQLLNTINDLIDSSFDKTVLIFLKAVFNCTYGTVQVICRALFVHIWWILFGHYQIKLIRSLVYGIIYFFLWLCSPARAMASSFTRFLDHTQLRATVGRIPLDEWSARRRDCYLTTHNTHNRQISMPLVGFEPMIAAGERP